MASIFSEMLGEKNLLLSKIKLIKKKKKKKMENVKIGV